MEAFLWKVAIILSIFVHSMCAQSQTLFAELSMIQNTKLESKYESNTGWNLPRDTIPRWFEYYNSTSSFRNATGDIHGCASVSQDFSSLGESEGIWVACQDPELPSDCHVVPESCHPVLTYNTGLSVTPGMRTVKLKFALYGLATLQLNASNQCFDYSYWEYPSLPPCKLIKITPDMVSNQWIHSQFRIDPRDNISIHSFSMEMKAVSAHDVVLLDKVEATEYFLCGPDFACTTTPEPTQTTSRTTTPLPRPRNDTLYMRNSTDTAPNQRWIVSDISTSPRWLEYYYDTNDFFFSYQIPNSCAKAFHNESVADNLKNDIGIWVACKDPQLPPEECGASSRDPCHPFIRIRNAFPEEAVGNITIFYFIHGKGAIRLNFSENKCVDYSYMRDSNSSCEFIELPANPSNEWQVLSYSPAEISWVNYFQIDMVATGDHDFVFIEEVIAEIYV